MGVSIVRLDDVAEVRLGRQRSPKNHMGDGMRPYLRAANVGWDGLLLRDIKMMNFTDAEMSVYRLRPGDLLLNEASGSPREVGKPAMWDGQIEDCAFQNTLLRVRPRPAISSRYLLHFFKHEAASGNFADRSRGVGIRHLGREALARTAVPLPSLADQRRIAEVLDEADALRAKRLETLAILGDLTQSIFLELFGRRESVWPEVEVGDLVDRNLGGIRTGPFGSQLLHGEFVEEGIMVLGIDNAADNSFTWGSRRYVTPEKYQELRRYTVHPGDVLITIMGTCGRAAIVPKSIPLAVNTKHLCCITLDRSKCLPEYLHSYFLVHPYARRYLEREAKGAIMSGLNMAIIKAMPIFLPPIGLQQTFVDAVEGITLAKSVAQAHRDEVEELFVALRQRAFAGEMVGGVEWPGVL